MEFKEKVMELNRLRANYAKNAIESLPKKDYDLLVKYAEARAKVNEGTDCEKNYPRTVKKVISETDKTLEE